jgi:hypothetical protein
MAKAKTKTTAPKTETPAPPAPEAPEPTTPEIKPVILGKTSRAVLDLVIACTFPKDDLDDDFVPEVLSARTICDRTEYNIGQVRTILRNLRGDDLIVVSGVVTPEDRTFRYEAAQDAPERLAAGDEVKAEKAAARAAKGTASSLANVEPMDDELYFPLALKLAAIDRAIVRWTGTAYRERKGIKDAGNDPSDGSTWAERVVSIDGTEHTLTANEVGPVLRKLRKTITDDVKFRVAQRNADRALVSIVKGDDPDADAPETADDEGEAPTETADETPAEAAAK